MMMRARYSLVAAFVGLPFLAACGDDHSTLQGEADNPSMTITEPAIFRQAREIKRDALSLVVSINGSEVGTATRSNDNYNITLNLVPGLVYRLTLLWNESYAGQSLPLASTEVPVQIPADARSWKVEVQRWQFDTSADSFDNDGDGYSNYEERRDGTDPLNAAEPGNRPAKTNLQLQFDLPLALTLASDEQLAMLELVVRVGGTPVGMTREGTSWFGDVDVNEGSEITVDAQFHPRGQAAAVLAEFRSDAVAADSGSFVVDAGRYTAGPDSDQDGFYNVLEFLAGSDPLDPNDPLDPSELPNPENPFGSDSDGDGIPDDEDPDADGDTVNDSNDPFVDLSGDGLDDESGLTLEQATCHGLDGRTADGSAYTWQGYCELSRFTPGRNGYVLGVERVLWCLGFDVGFEDVDMFADGNFGSQTEVAVEAFQEANDLPVTGIVDMATWPALQSSLVAAAGLTPAGDVTNATPFSVAGDRCEGIAVFHSVSVNRASHSEWRLSQPMGGDATMRFSMHELP
ncbi:MAG: hypothetical protein CSB44_09340 [Gammaproteobacteria bacterium]|nr:MAG: hypothetical protein CSB44_09340 [Gammaproteobacteria bacterium]